MFVTHHFSPIKALACKSNADKELARERTIASIDTFNKAQTELERICKEKGMRVPEMICEENTPV